MRRMVDVALPAFTSSMDVTQGLVCTINHHPNGNRLAHLVSVVNEFTARHCPDITLEEPLTQCHLDELALRHHLDNLLYEANQVDHVLFLTANASHNGAWLSILPVEKLCLLLPNEALHTGVALRLGMPIQQPH